MSATGCFVISATKFSAALENRTKRPSAERPGAPESAFPPKSRTAGLFEINSTWLVCGNPLAVARKRKESSSGSLMASAQIARFRKIFQCLRDANLPRGPRLFPIRKRRLVRNRKRPEWILPGQLSNLFVGQSGFLEFWNETFRQRSESTLFTAVLLPWIIPTGIVRNQNSILVLRSEQGLDYPEDFFVFLFRVSDGIQLDIRTAPGKFFVKFQVRFGLRVHPNKTIFRHPEIFQDIHLFSRDRSAGGVTCDCNARLQ